MTDKLSDVIRAQLEHEYKVDRINIDEARKNFIAKDFNECLNLYKRVQHQTLLNELDKNIVKFSEGQI